MAIQDLLNSTIVSQFMLPFALIFFILFAILEKTKILGDNKHTLNVWTAAVIALIFVSAVFPKQVVGNLILFLVIALVVVFVTLIIWGFTTGGEAKIGDGVKKLSAYVIVIAVVIAVFWAAGLRLEFLNELIDFLFYSNWSKEFWTNAVFVGFIAIAIALTLKGSSDKKS
ncbi:MAG: hypothetical protein AABX93_03405 [Nanoarchaeota archaeon]